MGEIWEILTSFFRGLIKLRTFEDMGEGGVNKPGKSGDVLYGRPPVLILSFAISDFRNKFSIGSRKITFCSGTFQVTLTESWQRNRNLLLKFRKFQNENLKSSHCPKYERKKLKVFRAECFKLFCS